MEDRLKAIIDALTEDDVKELISQDMDNISFKVGRRTAERIKNMTFAKAGMIYDGRPKKIVLFNRKLVAAAAILIIMAGILSIFGFENVTAAVNKFFRFIPGFGIITEESPITYAARERNVTVENDTHRMTLKTAVATSNTVTVSLDVVYKEFEKPGVKTSKEEILEKLDTVSGKPGLYLCSENERIETSSSQRGGGGMDYYTELVNATFYLGEKKVTDGSIFELSYDDIGLSVEFQFVAYDSFSELTDIGPTDVQNNISITAIPTYQNGSLMVELYPVNKSKFEIYGLINRLWEECPVADEELHLETEVGDVPYRLPEGGYSGYYRHFYFDIPDQEGSMTLKIPYIIVKAKEKAEKTIRIPEPNQSKDVDIPFKFSEGTMRLTQVERIKGNEEGFDKEADGIKLTFALESNKDNMKLYIATPDMWKPQSCAYRWEYDKDNNKATLWYYPESIKTGRCKLSLDEPLYILTDPYIIEIHSDISESE